MTGQTEDQKLTILPEGWGGLGFYNYYFLFKFFLLWEGYLNFHPLDNLAFAAFLLFPIKSFTVRKVRQVIAALIGFALLWHDTWLPGPGSIIHQGDQVAQFSWSYLLELVERFINWKMVEAGFVLLVGWMFFSLWLRITTFVMLGLLWLAVQPAFQPFFTRSRSPETNAVVQNVPALTATSSSSNGSDGALSEAQDLPPTQANLNSWLGSFFLEEEKRKVHFPDRLPENATPFDLLVINICSMSWADLKATGLDTHPLWSHFDVLFQNFNSATSYSGPAAIRLLRASCGQPAHKALYRPTDQDCYLFSDLAKLGFMSHLVLDHNGIFGDFLGEVRQFGAMQAPLMKTDGLPISLLAFDNSPIYDDAAVLQRWQETRGDSKTQRSATFYNLLPLHDGNHYAGVSKTADYKARASKLLDELDWFLTQLEHSHRRVMVVVVPEHGAALEGDKMQIAGLRDIPSPSITHVPVGIKFSGMSAPHQGAPMEIHQPTSYFAIGSLVSRVVDGHIFVDNSIDWSSLFKDLPSVAAVSETADNVVIDYNGVPYVSVDKGDWIPYPQ